MVTKTGETRSRYATPLYRLVISSFVSRGTPVTALSLEGGATSLLQAVKSVTISVNINARTAIRLVVFVALSAQSLLSIVFSSFFVGLLAPRKVLVEHNAIRGKVVV
jgi:hypothetical protein